MSLSMRLYLLTAFLDYLRASRAPLSNYGEWNWVRRQHGLNAQSHPNVTTGRSGKPVRFIVFGIVEATDRKDVIQLVRPQWEAYSIAGRELGIRFDEQLLTLSHILELHGWPADIPGNTLILNTADYDVPAGTAVFVTCLLTIMEEAEDPDREKYILDVVNVDRMYLEVVDN
ncbi:hypothetical protein B0H13DRAFT_2312048 [Mycena leptocephala]|nr:hypothetical protein B0H13DRAFT_2312048 [Mycena leptocephala]